MRTWVKWTIGGVALVVLVIAALGATGAYFALRSLDSRVATESDAQREGDAIRARYRNRAPLIEVINPKTGDVRVNRIEGRSAAAVSTIHVLSWKAKEGQLVRTEVPLWLMRFSTLNVLSSLGIAPERFRLTADDVERYGPGIILDYRIPEADHVLLWVE